MKRVGVLTVLLLILFSFTLVFAAENETELDINSDEYKIEQAFDCLEEEVGTCASLTTQEAALTILATPDNVFDDCVKRLEGSIKSNHWQTDNSIRDTSLAILALDHAGKDTTKYMEWLLEQSIIPRELDWYIQPDSNAAMTCSISYGSNTPEIKVGENKKIEITGVSSGCLSLARNDFWLEISEDCYEEEFSVKCDQDFVSGLLYEGGTSIPRTVYVLEGTESAPAFESTNLKVRSKCFGTGTTCNYEATIWGALALKKAGKNIDDYVPYIIAMAKDNGKYLPDAFAYMLTNYEDYANSLVGDQELSGFWQPLDSVNKQYYDTAIAILALGSSSSNQVTEARNRLLFSQGANGCWRNQIKDTAAVLWALEGRAGRESSTDSVSTTYCSDAGYFCIPTSDCPSNEDVGDNFFCAGLSINTCCMTENLKTCSEYGGNSCLGDTFCVGNERKSSDIDACCTGTCEERPQESECEEEFYSCSDFCSATQEEAPYDCFEGNVCCRAKIAEAEKKSLWWIWLILFLVLATLGALAYVYREKLKEKYNEIKSKMGKDGKGKPGASGMPPRRPGMPPRGMPPRRPGMPPRGMPPRPGFPPIVRQPMPQGTPRPGYKEDPAMKETFRKLRRIAAR